MYIELSDLRFQFRSNIDKRCVDNNRRVYPWVKVNSSAVFHTDHSTGVDPYVGMAEQ